MPSIAPPPPTRPTPSADRVKQSMCVAGRVRCYTKVDIYADGVEFVWSCRMNKADPWIYSTLTHIFDVFRFPLAQKRRPPSILERQAHIFWLNERRDHLRCNERTSIIARDYSHVFHIWLAYILPLLIRSASNWRYGVAIPSVCIARSLAISRCWDPTILGTSFGLSLQTFWAAFECRPIQNDNENVSRCNK